ncbi:MAG: hypothetical protein AB9891_08330 [Anaerolineaceae bacterium]
MPETQKTTSIRVIRTPITFSRLMLMVFLAFFSVSGWLRVSQAFANQNWIETMRIFPGSLYFIISGAAWGSLLLAALAGVLFQYKWAGWFTISAAVFVSAWRWFERLVFVRSPFVNTGWVFELILNAVLLLVVFFMMKGYPPVMTGE